MLTRAFQAFALLSLAVSFASPALAQCGPGGCAPMGGGGYYMEPQTQQGGYMIQPGGIINPGIIQPGNGQPQQQQPFDPGGNDPRFPPGATVPGTPQPGQPAQPGTTPKPQTEPDCCQKLMERLDAIDKKLEAFKGCQCNNDELTKYIKELQIAVKNQTGEITKLGSSQESIKKIIDGYDKRLDGIEIALKNSVAETSKTQEAYYQKLAQTLSGGMKIRLQFDPNTGQVSQLPVQ